MYLILLHTPSFLLEIRVIIKILKNPCYPINVDWFSLEWSKKIKIADSKKKWDFQLPQFSIFFRENFRNWSSDYLVKSGMLQSLKKFFFGGGRQYCPVPPLPPRLRHACNVDSGIRVPIKEDWWKYSGIFSVQVSNESWQLLKQGMKSV